MHDTPSQLWLPVHVTSHAHDVPHSIVRHDAEPVQLTSHGPAPHVTPRHAWVALHSTVHAVAPPHATPLRHEPSVSHLTSHFSPGGQLIWPEQLVKLQSIVHVPLPHDVHGDGQLLPSGVFWPSTCATGASIEPSTTQNPLSQIRPLLQSDVFVHAKSGLRCVTEQLTATAIAAPSTMPTTADFIARLRG